MQKKEVIDPRIVAKNQQEAKNGIKGFGVNPQEIAKLKKAILTLGKNGEVSAVYDKFNSAVKKFPIIGKYRWCKGCEADTPNIDGDCAICGKFYK